ncbi:unnamed protein product, partial [Closterium sp. NIES-53]
YPYVWPDVVDIWRKQKTRKPAKSVAPPIPVDRKGKQKAPEPEEGSDHDEHPWAMSDDE